MNIFMISPNPIWGGAATANIAIAQMLSKEHTVYYNDEYFNLSIEGVVYDNYPTHQSKDSHQLIAHLQSKKIDVVIWGVAMAIPYYRKAAKLLHKLGIKQVVVFHSLAIVNSFKGRMMEKLIALSLKYIDDLVFVSKYTDLSWSEKYRAIHKHPNHYVIYNPISVDKKNDVKTTSNRIGFVGRFSEEKQPELFAQLSVNDDVNRYIAWGDGPLRGDLKKKYPKVDFRGHSSNQKEMYDSIDILVMTSQFENCPMVILEAWKYGIPCVVPNVGGIPEIVKNGYSGLLYDEFSIEIIADAIYKIQSNYSQYSIGCMKEVANYSYDKIFEKWQLILQD